MRQYPTGFVILSVKRTLGPSLAKAGTELSYLVSSIVVNRASRCGKAPVVAVAVVAPAFRVGVCDTVGVDDISFLFILTDILSGCRMAMRLTQHQRTAQSLRS